MDDTKSEISYSYEELIPVAKYSNVKVGPIIIKKIVTNGKEEDAIMELTEICESIARKKRDEILKDLEQGSS